MQFINTVIACNKVNSNIQIIYTVEKISFLKFINVDIKINNQSYLFIILQ